MVTGTGLQWFATTPGAAAAPANAASGPILDLSGTTPAAAGTWRLTVNGAPLLQPFAGLAVCQRRPWVAAVVLHEATDDGAPRSLAEAHISSRLPYRALLHRLALVAGHLLRTALLRTDDASPVRADEARAPLQARLSPSAPRFVWGERLRIAAATTAHRWHSRMLSEAWAIGDLPGPAQALLAGGRPPITWRIAPGPEGNYADPFPWPGRPGTILCERYGRTTGPGQIVAISGDGIAPTRLDLGLHCHLSYPFTWTEPEGRHFCVPEASAARQTIIYELDPAGAAYRHATVDTQRAIGDPTVFCHGGLYWLAYCDEDLGGHETLCLLYAERLTGPWQPHRHNPVKIDIRSARPGGTPFEVDGVLYRPAQDCSLTYGGALVINRVETCTPCAYAESPVARLCPDPHGPFPDGLHTLSVAGDRLLVDGKRLTASPTTLLRKALARLRHRASAGARHYPTSGRDLHAPDRQPPDAVVARPHRRSDHADDRRGAEPGRDPVAARLSFDSRQPDR